MFSHDFFSEINRFSIPFVFSRRSNVFLVGNKNKRTYSHPIQKYRGHGCLKNKCDAEGKGKTCRNGAQRYIMADQQDNQKSRHTH